MSKTYGKPRAALDALEHSAPIHIGPSSTSPPRSMDFGASAFFGGTAADNSSENEEEPEISLDEIKRRYLKKNLSDDQTQRVGDGAVAGTDENHLDDTQAVDILSAGRTQLIVQTQLINDDKTQVVHPVDFSRADSSVDFSKDTVDLLPNSVHQPQSDDEDLDMEDSSQQKPLITAEIEKEISDREDDDEDDDDDIIVHKKRSYSVLTDFLEDESEVSEGESGQQSAKKMKKTKESQPVKRLSKKAIEETEMESARTGRGLELAPEVKTGKELTVEGFLDNFVSDSKTSDASPQKSSEELATPQTSPVSVKDHAQEDQEQPVSSIKIKKLVNRDFKNLITPRRLASFVKSTSRNNDSDDELEIIPSTKASTTSDAIKNFAKLADINLYKTRVPLSKRTSPQDGMKTRSLMDTLAFKQREQAKRHRDERMAELKARGLDIMSQEEKQKEDEAVESLLDRERRYAEEVRKREKREKREAGSDDEMDPDFDADFDEDEEADYDNEEEEADDDDDEGDREEEMEEESDEEVESNEASKETQENGTLEVSASQSFSANIAEDAPMDGTYESDDAEPHFIESSQNAADDADEATQLSQYPDPTQSPIGSPSHKEKNIDDQEQMSEFEDDEDDGERIKVKGRRRLLQPKPRVEKPKFDKKKSAARAAVDDEAAESEDEWAGVGGADNKSDDEGDNEHYNLENLVDDNTGENAQENENQELWAEKERERDEALVHKLVDDVTNGGWRRRKAATGGFLDLSDDDEVDLERERLKRQERMAQRLLDDANLKNMAQDPKAQAFVASIIDQPTIVSSTDDQENQEPKAQSISESLSFLDAREELDIEEEQVTIVNTGDTAIQRAVHIKTVDRITERRSFVARARREDSNFSKRRSIAVVESRYKADPSKKEVKVVQSLTNSSFGSGNKSSVVVKRQLLAPSIIRRGNTLPKSASLGTDLFKKGGWE